MQIETNMRNGITGNCTKENQVTFRKVSIIMKRLHIFCKELLRRCAGYLDVVHITEQALNKARAIDPVFIVTAIFVRRFHPFINEHVEYNIAKTIRINFQIGGIFSDRSFFRFGTSGRCIRIGRFYHNGLVLVGGFARTGARNQEHQ